MKGVVNRCDRGTCVVNRCEAGFARVVNRCGRRGQQVRKAWSTGAECVVNRCRMRGQQVQNEPDAASIHGRSQLLPDLSRFSRSSQGRGDGEPGGALSLALRASRLLVYKISSEPNGLKVNGRALIGPRPPGGKRISEAAAAAHSSSPGRVRCHPGSSGRQSPSSSVIHPELLRSTEDLGSRRCARVALVLGIPCRESVDDRSRVPLPSCSVSPMGAALLRRRPNQSLRRRGRRQSESLTAW